MKKWIIALAICAVVFGLAYWAQQRESPASKGFRRGIKVLMESRDESTRSRP